jgi:tetratricopeptide (TPR) repeat protein
MTSVRGAWLAAVCAVGAQAMAQVPLAEVGKIARARAARSLPAQQKALEPYWADLALNYQINQQVLDAKIKEVVALGDGLVPLLLEKLQPAQGGETARHLAANCARVLDKLDPASFVDALVELANGTNDIGRAEAIRLLGVANTPQAVAQLSDMLDRSTGEERRQVIRALTAQRAPGAAPKIVVMLASNDQKVREDVLAYLVAAKPPQVADTVLQALPNEKVTRLLAQYVEYFGGAVKGNDAVARALLPLLERDKLYAADAKRLLQLLATIAPADHEPTVRRLHEMLDGGEVTSLTVQAAVTMRALGDKQGVTKLKRTIDSALRRSRNDAALYEQRANLAFAIEDYDEAMLDYTKARDLQDGSAMLKRAYVGMMRSEARRKKASTQLTKLMKESGMLVAEIKGIGDEDPQFEEVLQQDKVRAFLATLAKEQEPK